MVARTLSCLLGPLFHQMFDPSSAYVNATFLSHSLTRSIACVTPRPCPGAPTHHRVHHYPPMIPGVTSNRCIAAGFNGRNIGPYVNARSVPSNPWVSFDPGRCLCPKLVTSNPPYSAEIERRSPEPETFHTQLTKPPPWSKPHLRARI